MKKLERDAEGKIVAEYFPDETSVKYSFDKLGRLSNVIDQNGNPIEFRWNKFGGIEERANAASQKISYISDKYGLTQSVEKKGVDGTLAQSIKYSYDRYDRVNKLDYGNGQEKRFEYDKAGRLISVETFENGVKTGRTGLGYDQFDRVQAKAVTSFNAKNERSELLYNYSYDKNGKLIAEHVVFPDKTSRDIERYYDRFGRLTQIKDGAKVVNYSYDQNSRLAKQEINGVPVNYRYTKSGQLEAKLLGDPERPIASLIYIYDINNTLKGRVVNGVTQNFIYDKKGQLTGVTDSNGAILESYKYDAAGNILEKVINGAAVKYTYDKANQLLTATMPDGIRKSYKYDAAGRLVEETAGTASKSYSYGWSDKVTKVTDGKTESSFSYYPNGQLAKRSTTRSSEDFYWDGLALLKRDNTNYMNEPYVTGGNPVLADDKLVFNDMLGTSIGSIEDGNFKYIPRTAFGETEDKSDVNFFTGKPDVAELGYNFMFRNYRADLGKWQTQDPLGYPDGWNNFAYCNNGVFLACDSLGLFQYIDGYAYISITTQNGRVISNTKVDSAQQFMDLISAIGYSSKITDLTIRAHGSDDGNITFGETIVNSGNEYNDSAIGLSSSQAQTVLMQNIADNANIVVESCYQGLDNGIAKTISQDIPTATVTGFTGPVTNGQGIVPSFPGLYWLISNTRTVKWKNGKIISE